MTSYNLSFSERFLYVQGSGSRLFFPPPLYKAKALGSFCSHLHRPTLKHDKGLTHLMAAAVDEYTKEKLPSSLDASAEPPALFDGTTRLYISYTCPYAQRTWIARNYKGLEEKIELVPIDLQNRPAWYKEKVYSKNKVPSLEHKNEVKGESLDLLKYIDEHFEGPSLILDDLEKKTFAEELLAYSDSFNSALFASIRTKGDVGEEVDVALNKIEQYLSKFSDGPFFLGQFSLVDIAYAPFIERFQIFFAALKKYDITNGRPKLGLWIESTSSFLTVTLEHHLFSLSKEETIDSYATSSNHEDPDRQSSCVSLTDGHNKDVSIGDDNTSCYRYCWSHYNPLLVSMRKEVVAEKEASLSQRGAYTDTATA